MSNETNKHRVTPTDFRKALRKHDFLTFHRELCQMQNEDGSGEYWMFTRFGKPLEEYWRVVRSFSDPSKFTQMDKLQFSASEARELFDKEMLRRKQNRNLNAALLPSEQFILVASLLKCASAETTELEGKIADETARVLYEDDYVIVYIDDDEDLYALAKPMGQYDLWHDYLRAMRRGTSYPANGPLMNLFSTMAGDSSLQVHMDDSGYFNIADNWDFGIPWDDNVEGSYWTETCTVFWNYVTVHPGEFANTEFFDDWASEYDYEHVTTLQGKPDKGGSYTFATGTVETLVLGCAIKLRKYTNPAPYPIPTRS